MTSTSVRHRPTSRRASGAPAHGDGAAGQAAWSPPAPPGDGEPVGLLLARLHAAEVEARQLREAMAHRATIEQAKGVLMLLTSCSEHVAFALLAHISSVTHRKVREVAAELVASAAGRQELPVDVRLVLHDACPPSRR